MTVIYRTYQSQFLTEKYVNYYFPNWKINKFIQYNKEF